MARSGRGRRGTLAAAALAGEEIALAAFERAGQAVGMAIAGAAAVCDLDLAVIGGGVAQAGELLFEPVRRALKTHAGLSYLAGLEVRAAELGGQAGLVGAAALVADRLTGVPQRRLHAPYRDAGRLQQNDRASDLHRTRRVAVHADGVRLDPYGRPDTLRTHPSVASCTHRAAISAGSRRTAPGSPRGTSVPDAV